MDIIRLYQDYSITFVTEGHKHARPGWANMECPWCTGEHEGYHLGYNLENNYYFCWRCGWHPILPTLAKVTHLPEQEVRKLVRQYGLLLSRPIERIDSKQNKKEFALPSGITSLSVSHKSYLLKRGYHPDEMEQIWGLISTGPVSKLDGIDYKNRIIIPFHWDEGIVSFDSRSTSLNLSHEKRYKACPKDRERIPHKSILYGRPEEWRETGICVEGPTDVWRLGVEAFATSGIQYTYEQLRLMSQMFKRIFVIYDYEPQAQIQAKKLVADLRFRGVEAYNVEIKEVSDPGELNPVKARQLVNKLINS